MFQVESEKMKHLEARGKYEGLLGKHPAYTFLNLAMMAQGRIGSYEYLYLYSYLQFWYLYLCFGYLIYV